MLHMFGIDHNRFTYKFQGLDFRLTGVEESRVVHDFAYLSRAPFLPKNWTCPRFSPVSPLRHSFCESSHIRRTGQHQGERNLAGCGMH